MITDDFWNRLEQQADAGNPAARYLFATLMRSAPSQTTLFEHWDEALEHREQAREYTWRNLNEREPLGLLAAVNCGLNTPELLQMVDQTLQQVERMEKTQPGALERLNTASDQALRMFCK